MHNRNPIELKSMSNLQVVVLFKLINRQYITKEDYMSLPRESNFSIDWKANYVRSSKIEKLMEFLGDILKKGEKCIIFT